MRKNFLPTLAIAAMAATIAACTAETNPATNRAPGTYKATTSSTNASGTDVKKEQTTNVYRDASGNKKAVVKTETSTDPKGLFNKETSTTYKKYE